MRSAILFIVLCRCAAAQQSGIEGMAVDAVTRQPLPGVHITLREATVDGASPGDLYGAISKADGHFSIAGVKPDSYAVKAQRNGYLYLGRKTANGRTDSSVTLKAGEPVTDFRLEMTPEAVISGRLVDEFGDPAQHWRIDAAHAGSRVMIGGSETDERGQFRLVVPPGKYQIRAILDRINILDRPEIRADGREAAVYGETYYPASPTRNQASVIEAAPGREVTGIEIRLSPRRSFTIRGSVTGMTDPVAVSAVRYFGGTMSNAVVTSPNGKFMITGLAPGAYRLQASQQTQSTLLRSREVEVQLDSADENGVSLALLPGETLAGTLEIDGNRMEELRVALDEEIEGAQSKAGEVGRDGAFRLEQVFPGKFRVRVLPMPENAFVKSVKVDTTETQSDMVDLSHGVNGAKMKVTVSRNGGQVEGLVLGGDGEPLKSPVAFVVLAASAEEVGRVEFKPVTAGTKFLYAGLRPGKYRLIAVDGREFAGELEDGDAMFAKAPEIEIREGDRIQKDVKVMDEVP